MSFTEQLSKDAAVSVSIGSLAHAAAIEDFSQKVKLTKIREHEPSERAALIIKIPMITIDKQGKTSIEDLTQWMGKNGIEYRVASARSNQTDTEMRQEVHRSSTTLGLNFYDIELVIEGFASIRKMAVAGFEFPGANILRLQNAQQSAQSSAKV